MSMQPLVGRQLDVSPTTTTEDEQYWAELQERLRTPLCRYPTRPIRLGDVPLSVRLRAAENLMRNEEYAEERIELMHAAHFPSEKIYHVEAAAVMRVLGDRNGHP